ncbi:MAG: serine hydrolase domain-containing protein [Mycobacterium sp.]
MGTPVVNVSKFVSAVESRLDNSVVGYSFVIGGAAVPAVKHSAGSARTAANAPALPFQTSTPTGVGSVSKFITAIAAVQLLDRPDAGGVEGWNELNANLDTPMYKALPVYWDLRTDIQQITFRDLLTHTSGLAAEGAKGEPGLDYFSLKTYLSPHPAAGTTPLGARGSYAYSNVGFALFRLLLPNIVGLVSTTPPGNYEQQRADEYAIQFQNILNDNIWGQLKIVGPSQGTPAGNNHAFMYVYPGSSSGYDWGQWKYNGQTALGEGQPLCAGAGTAWLSIDWFTPVLDSINKMDQRLLTVDQWSHMQGIGVPSGYQNYGMGIDQLNATVNGNQYRWVEKNGGLGWFVSSGGGSLSASVAFFGSMEPGSNPDNGPFYATLFINSDVSGGPGATNGWFYCQKCNSLYFTNSTGNVCPANGQAHTAGGQYILSTAQQPGGQSNWRQCSKCAALCYEPSATDPSKCPAGGRHTPTGNTFVLNQSGQSDFEHQAGWRWCKNCGVQAYSGGNSSAGACAASGPHEFILSGSNYAIQTLIGADTVLLEAFKASI